MKVSKTMKIEGVASKDCTRYAINFADLKGDKLTATDGTALVQVKVQRDETDVDGFVPIAALKEGRRLATANKNREVEIELNGCAKLTNGATFERPGEDSGTKFPDVTEVMPSGAIKVKIGLDAEKLLAIAEALNDGNFRGRVPYLCLEIFENSTGPIRITRSTDAGASEADFGLLMPVRLS